MLDVETKCKVLLRLKRIEGQVGGVRRMVEEDQHCVDVLLQISAVQGALGQAGKIVLGSHMETCVSEALISGDGASRKKKIDELVDVFSRYGGTRGR